MVRVMRELEGGGILVFSVRCGKIWNRKKFFGCIMKFVWVFIF